MAHVAAVHGAGSDRDVPGNETGFGRKAMHDKRASGARSAIGVGAVPGVSVMERSGALLHDNGNDLRFFDTLLCGCRAHLLRVVGGTVKLFDGRRPGPLVGAPDQFHGAGGGRVVECYPAADHLVGGRSIRDRRNPDACRAAAYRRVSRARCRPSPARPAIGRVSRRPCRYPREEPFPQPSCRPSSRCISGESGWDR